MTTVNSLSGAFSTLRSKSSSYVARIAGSTWALLSGKFLLVSFSLIGMRREGMIVVVDGAGDDEVIMDLSIEKNLEIGCLRS
jgi:hypothetical protein